MTVEEKVRRALSKNLSKVQIDDILGTFKESEHGKPMKGRWSQPAKDYLPTFFAALLMSIKLAAQPAAEGER